MRIRILYSVEFLPLLESSYFITLHVLYCVLHGYVVEITPTKYCSLTKFGFVILCTKQQQGSNGDAYA